MGEYEDFIVGLVRALATIVAALVAGLWALVCVLLWVIRRLIDGLERTEMVLRHSRLHLGGKGLGKAPLASGMCPPDQKVPRLWPTLLCKDFLWLVTSKTLVLVTGCSQCLGDRVPLSFLPLPAGATLTSSGACRGSVNARVVYSTSYVKCHRHRNRIAHQNNS